MSSVPCYNSIRSEGSFSIALVDILPRIRSHRVDVLPSVWLGSSRPYPSGLGELNRAISQCAKEARQLEPSVKLRQVYTCVIHNLGVHRLLEPHMTQGTLLGMLSDLLCSDNGTEERRNHRNLGTSNRLLSDCQDMRSKFRTEWRCAVSTSDPRSRRSVDAGVRAGNHFIFNQKRPS